MQFAELLVFGCTILRNQLAELLQHVQELLPIILHKVLSLLVFDTFDVAFQIEQVTASLDVIETPINTAEQLMPARWILLLRHLVPRLC